MQRLLGAGGSKPRGSPVMVGDTNCRPRFLCARLFSVELLLIVILYSSLLHGGSFVCIVCCYVCSLTSGCCAGRVDARVFGCHYYA